MCRTQNIVSKSQIFRLDLKPQDPLHRKGQVAEASKGHKGTVHSEIEFLHIFTLTKPTEA